MKNKLILVEGLPGSGKSTIGQYIWLEAKKNDVKVEYICESEKGHPTEVDPDGGIDVGGFKRESLRAWSDFTDRLLAADAPIVLEGSFFTTPTQLPRVC